MAVLFLLGALVGLGVNLVVAGATKVARALRGTQSVQVPTAEIAFVGEAGELADGWADDGGGDDEGIGSPRLGDGMASLIDRTKSGCSFALPGLRKEVHQEGLEI